MYELRKELNRRKADEAQGPLVAAEPAPTPRPRKRARAAH
jgi:hypothetical protein